MARNGWGFEVGRLTAVEELGWNTDRLAMSNQAVGSCGGDWSVTISGASISGPRTPTLANAKYIGFAVEPITSPTEFVVIFESGTTAQCSVLFKTDGSIDLYRGDRFGGTVIDSSGVVYNPAAVNWVEIEVVAANSGSVELQINGASVYTYSGDTQDSGSSGWTRVRLADVFVAASVRVDNVVLSDSTETWIGAMPLVQVKRPTSVASGNLTGTPTTGSNRYQNVDDDPFDTA